MSVFILLLVQTLYQTVIACTIRQYIFMSMLLTVGREKVGTELQLFTLMFLTFPGITCLINDLINFNLFIKRDSDKYIVCFLY